MSTGLRAAGILFVLPDGRILLMHRVSESKQDGIIPGCWAFPGGGLEGDETCEQAARREIEEETGLAYTGPLTLWTRRIRDQVDFTTFLAKVDSPFPITLNAEHDAYHWVNRDFAIGSALLHPGVHIALSRFTMDELGVAKSIRDGELTSPQYYGKDLMLIALRITGTGLSYRSAHKEYVWRDSSIYMNPEFLERCNGLPVIFRHPKKTLLNTDEFRDRIVGTIFVPYLRPDVEEVWGIAKILDMDAAGILQYEPMSTSPAVLCLGDKQTISGEKVLFEDKPFLLDHLALLIPNSATGDAGAGVWDKGLGFSGVESVDAVTVTSEDVLDLILRKVQLGEIVHRIQ